MREVIGKYIINNPIFWIIIAAIILLIIFRREISSNSNKKIVSKILNKLPKDNYLVLSDVVIKTTRKVHKIENLVISNYGIFVINFLDINGKVYGDDRGEEWIEISNNKKRYFENPVRVNHSSIRVLSSLLGLDSNYFISIICYNNDPVLSTETKDKITSIDILDDTIKTYKKEIIKYGLSEIKDTILSANIVNEKDSSPDTSKKINITNECPKCGSKLVKRKGKYGDFIGCSNYPTCKYTREL